MVEKLSTFLKTFGPSPIFKVLDFFMVHEEFDYSMTDIAKFSGVGYSTLKIFWPKLEKNKIIVMTRIVGKARLYRLNNKNSIVKSFKAFYWQVTKQKTRQMLKPLTQKIRTR